MFTYARGNGAGLSQVVKPDQGSNGIVLGLNRGPFNSVDYNKGLPWYLNSGRGHGLCFSGTGGGKNTNLITGGLLTYGGSALVVDPKGENAWITAERRRKIGQRVVILDPWDQVNETYGGPAGVKEITSKFNPLSNLDPKSKEFNDELMMIADGIIIIPERADPHWTESARDLVTGLLAAAIEKAPGVATFRQVRELLTGDLLQLQAAVTNIVKNNPSSYAARKLSRFTQTTKEIASIRSTAETQTAIFDSARLLDSMETDANAFELADLASQRVTLYLVLPPEYLQTHGRWMRLIIQLALRAISRSPQPPKIPVLFLLDELGTINPGGGLPAIEQAYGLLGGMGIRIWGFFQDLSQLQRDYPNTWRNMITNCETIQILRLNETDTADYFSRMLGTKTVREVREGKVIGHHGRPLMFARELMELPSGEVICFRSGTPAFRLKSIPYFKNPLFAGLYRPNPLYPASAPVSAGMPLGPINLPPVPDFVKAWAKQPIACAVALALLLVVYGVMHISSERARVAAEAETNVILADRAKMNAEAAQFARQEDQRLAIVRQDILAHQDKIMASINPAMLAEMCRRR